ncbi:MAG: STAS domain-containing protein [Pseudomonadota bacterium]|nr:STAS domain-containing protein [Pseudomonadota bacterium]
MSGPAAEAQRHGDTLALSGPLVLDAVVGLWPRLRSGLDGLARIDLSGVQRVDSAGVALVAELASRITDPTIVGAPQGWNELCSAYRLDFAGPPVDPVVGG